MLKLLLLLIFTSRAWTAAAQADSATDSILYTNCSETAGFYGANSTYKSNILRIGADLAAQASSTGFASGSFGTNPDTVYGLVLCRGDYTGPSCTEDLNKTFRSATTNTQLCKGYNDVTLYYDQYMLRFSNQDFRPGLSNEPVWPASNENNVTGADAARRFMDLVVELVNATADFAAFNASRRPRYATGEAWFGEQGVDKLYGLVQCTPDFAEAKCRSCLAGIIAQMPAQFSDENGTSIGGRILGVRCNLRYEKDLFFDESSDTLELHMPKKGMSTLLKIVIFGVPFLVLLISGLLLRPYIVREVRELLLQRDLVILEKEIVSESDSRFSQFRFSKIRDATNNFSEQNKIGEGGFGPVYQGLLPNNQEIAVKRLSPNSTQGFREFRNEIKLIASLQHRNLVRLLGCCVNSKERMLVYEYMPIGSLEEFIFGSGAKQTWHVRRRIIEGIAEGLLYIHDYAHACIVHRDLKPSNILLDHDVNPKISDFGIARICLSNVTESNTTTAMGTFGYMAPEYLFQNVYSTRSDVFSYGILVLEIISGKRAVGSYKLSGRSYDFRRYAWQLWKDERCDEFVDPSLGEEYQEMDIIRCIQVSLLCVQDRAEDRPTMHDVTTMLSSRNRRLLMPAQPGLPSI